MNACSTPTNILVNSLDGWTQEVEMTAFVIGCAVIDVGKVYSCSWTAGRVYADVSSHAKAQPTASDDAHSGMNKSCIAKRTAAFWGGVYNNHNGLIYCPFQTPHLSSLCETIFLPPELMIESWCILNEKLGLSSPCMPSVHTSMLTAISSIEDEQQWCCSIGAHLWNIVSFWQFFGGGYIPDLFTLFCIVLFIELFWHGHGLRFLCE